jgi:hypothetical protein
MQLFLMSGTVRRLDAHATAGKQTHLGSEAGCWAWEKSACCLDHRGKVFVLKARKHAVL